ncbi:isochorismatase family protein [Gryllotalpicola kribbensis]|jgi:nicotinamidase-related amidase|uniref:Isochorismatase family protein n=1 Tax=Gryllotalpicola kribbensis TaxID=993084 RepID=A0ABP8AM55_9MICO
MALTTLDQSPALVVIDLQNGTTAYPTIHPVSEVIERSRQLARAFRAHGHPVVLVNVAGAAPGRTDAGRNAPAPAPRPADWADLVEDLDAQPDDLLITKSRWGAFHDTSLDEQLQARGVTQVVLTGLATSMGVESTARSAHEHGYHVVIATDAVTDVDAEAHENSLRRIFPKLSESAATDELLAALDARS